MAALVLVLVGTPVASQARRLPNRLRVRAAGCPCTLSPFFSSFLDGQRQLVACTDNSPSQNFVRLVAESIDLVVLYEFPPQLYCGQQASGSNTSAIPISAEQFDSCKRLIVAAAARQGMACVPEILP
jgi:DNA-binding transcriptional LysR family regulator